MTYMDGWAWGCALVAAGFSAHECLRYARMTMRIRKSDDLACGFFDAVLSAVGA